LPPVYVVDVFYCDLLLSSIRDVMNLKEDEWGISGNVHYVDVSRSGTEISSSIIDHEDFKDSGLIPNEDLITILESWRKCLASLE
jgi:hypothetical protein